MASRGQSLSRSPYPEYGASGISARAGAPVVGGEGAVAAGALSLPRIVDFVGRSSLFRMVIAVRNSF